MMIIALIKRRPVASIWSKPRSVQWWDMVIGGVQDEEWWRENLRMSKTTFDILCRELSSHIKRQDTSFRKCVAVEARVAITVWRLATNMEYRSLAALFGIGRSTAGEIFLETCEVIAKVLFPKYVKFPNNEGLREVVNGYKTKWGFPQVVGAIDGTHIPIVRPKDSAADYYNRKGFYSIIVQGTVDYRGIFLDAYIGWPGKVHDARVFTNSSLYSKMSNGLLLPDWSITLGSSSTLIPLLFLGDPAYPLLPWLMKPYPENVTTTAEEKLFNYRQSRARMVVENAFGRLKGRWRCLLKRLDIHISNVPNVVASCITLHNICEKYGDYCHPDWITQDTPGVSAPPPTSVIPLASSATDIRDSIKTFLNQ